MYQKTNATSHLLIMLCCLFLASCTQSSLSRNIASDRGDVADCCPPKRSTGTALAKFYQNSSQTTKGIVIGGVTGGLIGSLNSGVGFIAGSATGAILGGAIGAYMESHRTLVEKLESRGAKVFILGDYVLIVLPSANLFYNESATLSSGAYETLGLVNQIVGNYTNMSVTVAGYSNESDSAKAAVALTKKQAETVAKALWRGGIDTRLLYATGYGAAKLVEAEGGYWNDRIEITWEKLPT